MTSKSVTPKPAEPEPEPAWASGLSIREQKFVQEFIVDLSGRNAAIRAGLGKTVKSATEIASRMRKKSAVAAAISQLIAERSGTTSTAVLNEVACIAFAKLTDFVQIKNGKITVTDTDKLSDDQKAAIAEIAVDENGNVVKVKLHEKGPSLDKLMKVVGLYDLGGSGGPNGGDRGETEDAKSRLAQMLGLEAIDTARQRVTERLERMATRLNADASGVTILPPPARQMVPFVPVKTIDAE